MQLTMAQNYMRQKFIKIHGEIEGFIFTAGDFSTPLPVIDGSISKKVNNDTAEWKSIIN